MIPKDRDSSGKESGSSVPLRHADEAMLSAIGSEQQLGLAAADMLAIRSFFREAGREPTTTELKLIGRVWGKQSDFRILSAVISYDGPPPGPDGHAPAVRQTIEGLLPRNKQQTGMDLDELVASEKGVLSPDGRWQIHIGEQLVCDLPLDFLIDGWPPLSPEAYWRPPAPVEASPDAPEPAASTGEHLLAVLTLVGDQIVLDDKRPALEAQDVSASSTDVTSEVTFETVSVTASAPPYTPLDPYRMAWAGVDKVRSLLLCAGADPHRIVVSPKFHIEDVGDPESLGVLVRSVQGFEDAAAAVTNPKAQDYTRPLHIMTNRKEQWSPDTPPLRFQATAELTPDTSRPGQAFRQAGNFIFIVGQTRPELGSSRFGAAGGRVRPQHSHAPGPIEEPLRRQRTLHAAIRATLVRACIYCGEGGIGLALARLCIAGDIGADVQMWAIPVDPYYAYAADEAILFSETLGRYLVEVRPEDSAAFSAALGDVVHRCIGVIGGSELRIHPRLPTTADPLISIGIDDLRRARDGRTR